MNKKNFFFIGVVVLAFVLGMFLSPLKNFHREDEYPQHKEQNNNAVAEVTGSDTGGSPAEKNAEQEEAVIEKEIPYTGKLAILIDDVGMNTQTASMFGKVNKPLSFATLPFLPKSSEATEKLRGYGFEVILHMPMAGSSDDLNRKTKGILTIGMSGEEVCDKFDKALESVGEMEGFNNHMGSTFTSNESGMRVLLQYVKNKNMFYVDSKTTSANKGYGIAKELGIPTFYASRFLDNSKSIEDIKKEIKAAVRMANERKKVLVIGHYHKNMATALQQMTGYIQEQGVELVYVRDVLE